MRRILFVLMLLVLGTVAPRAQTLPAADQTEIQRVISEQIAAFRADDGVRAYGYAAPLIRQYFPTPDVFMSMVKKGYPPVYRPQSFKFGDAGVDAAGNPTQRVTIIGPDGKTYEARYTMQKQPDGTWKINGCALLEVPGLDA